MKRLLPVAFIFTLALSAQPWPPSRPYPGPPSGRYDPRGFDVLERARSDVRRAGSRSFFRGGESGHVRHAIEELDRFEQRLRYGRWDGHALDKAIEHVDHLARSSRINPRDREMLQQDVWSLREFRSRRGGLRGRY